VLGPADKVILDPGSSGQGVVPYLPLNELSRKTPAAPTTPATQSGASR
jgi:membrane protease subunit HflK